MKKIIFMLCVIFTTISYCQKYNLTSNVSGLDFSLSLDSTTYQLNDSLVAKLTIKNLSDVSYFIYDYSYYNYEPIFYESKLGFDLGGVFNLSFNRINKLRILKPSECLSYRLIAFDSLNVIKNTQYLLYADIGYFEYDEQLSYLATVSKKIVPVQDDDMYKLTVLHRRMFLGYLPIVLTPLK